MADLHNVLAALGSLRPEGRWRPVVTREDGGGRPEMVRQAGCAARAASRPRDSWWWRAAQVRGQLPTAARWRKMRGAWGWALGSPSAVCPAGWCGAAAGLACQLPTMWLLQARRNGLFPFTFLMASSLGQHLPFWGVSAVRQPCLQLSSIQPSPSSLICGVLTAAPASSLPTTYSRKVLIASVCEGLDELQRRKKNNKANPGIVDAQCLPASASVEDWCSVTCPRLPVLCSLWKPPDHPLQPKLFKVWVGDQGYQLKPWTSDLNSSVFCCFAI